MRYFVYVVCGEKAYTEQLNFSLKYLRYHSRYPILLLTDSSRNQGPVHHPQEYIIDIKTPENLSNNQASIFLETSLPRYLPDTESAVYCYLDSDVIAISDAINNVFEELKSWPLFADDHCSIDYHSPYALHCGCKQAFDYRKNAWQFIRNTIPEPENQTEKQRTALQQIFHAYKKQPHRHATDILQYLYNRYLSAKSSFTFEKRYHFDKITRTWHQDGYLIDYDRKHYLRKMRQQYGFMPASAHWQDKTGTKLIPETPHCSHLREFLKNDSGLSLPADFRHWNGGVFLFDNQSFPAFETWHYHSSRLMKNPLLANKYIDQLSLIITASEHDFQHKSRLPVKYNFITDSGNKEVAYHPDKGYTYNAFQTTFALAFLHVYHHWGQKKWSIWQAVQAHGIKQGIISENDLKNKSLFAGTE